MIDFSIIIVAYRSAPDLLRLLASLPPAIEPNSWHVTIIDNAQDDELIALVPGNERISAIRATTNLGYGGGLNLGLAASPPARHIIFLNPDIDLEPGSIRALGRELDAGAGAAVPLIVDEQGHRQNSLRREPTTLGALGDALFGNFWPTRPRWLSETVHDPLAYTATRSVDWATGAVLAVRSEVVAEVGQWDAERFFLYSEETDYARRIRAAGQIIRFVPDAVVRHRGGGSGTSIPLTALLEVNKVKYFRKWHGASASTLFYFVKLIHHSLRAYQPEARAALRSLLSSSARAALPGSTREAA